MNTNLVNPRTALVFFFLCALLFTNRSFATRVKSTRLFRFTNAVSHLRLSPQSRFMAFIENESEKIRVLKVLNIKTGNIFTVLKNGTGTSFVWAPHGHRLFYRSQKKPGPRSKIRSTIFAYDTKLRKSIVVQEIEGPSGYLSLDPKDLKIRTLASSKILVHKISYPGSRLSKWQKEHRQQAGHWVATQNGVLWVTHGHLLVTKIKDDESPLESFDISPDGESITWATKGGQVFASTKGLEAISLGFGRHPSWHPFKKTVTFSSARMLGSVVTRFNLKIANLKGQSRWLSHSQHSDESWPTWNDNGTSFLYTIDKTTDVYKMELGDDESSRKISRSEQRNSSKF